VNVLIAEDDPVLQHMLRTLLTKWGYEVVVAANGDAAWEILQGQDAPRLALLDWLMPGMDGVEICREARKRGAQAYRYLLLLSSKDDRVDIVDGLQSGADDYLTKPFHPDELRARLRAGERILMLEDRLVAAQQVLQFKASHDALTELLNRGAILETLQRELQRGRREKNSLGVLLLDLDHFKSINDRKGHDVGDEVLREASRRMLASVRSYDAVGRYGGEEFLILVPGCNSANARDRAEQIRVAIAGSPIETLGGLIRISASIGVASTVDGASWEADALVRAADVALYRAKRNGRNRVELALPVESSSETETPRDTVAPEIVER
jgi:two-component system cell cycle response regulator